MFLFGKQNIELIQDEMKQYDDFLVGDFMDSFHNLTFKDSMILTWAKNDCPASFILKVRDQSYFLQIGLCLFVDDAD